MIGIDLTCLSRNSDPANCVSGVEKYTNEIISEILKINGEGYNYCLITNTENKKKYQRFYKGVRVVSIPHFVVWLLRHLSAQSRSTVYNILVKRNSIDCIWIPFAMPKLSYCVKARSVYTVHDIIPFHENGQRHSIEWEKFISSADVVVAISNYVKQDIEKNFCKKDIKIIKNPICDDFNNQKAITELVGKKYILDINAYAKRKNATTLLRAFSLLNSTDLYLIFCGSSGSELPSLQAYARMLGVEDKTKFYFCVSDAEKNWLLNNAILFVSPTMSEGFGRTPVEAAMCRVPVITTKVDAVPEATKGLVNYYDNPDDPIELKEKIEWVLSNKCNNLSFIADEFAKEYSPAKIAAEYILLFKEMLNDEVLP